MTRQKTNAVYRVIERRAVNKKQGLSSDQTIVLTGTKGHQCPHLLRRVGYRDPATKKHYVFITNNFKLSAKTIADIYKERWQIEIFFRWIKQNLKIKTFIGTTENALPLLAGNRFEEARETIGIARRGARFSDEIDHLDDTAMDPP